MRHSKPQKKPVVAVQPCIFLPAYRGQEACDVRLMKTPGKKCLRKQAFDTFFTRNLRKAELLHFFQKSKKRC